MSVSDAMIGGLLGSAAGSGRKGRVLPALAAALLLFSISSKALAEVSEYALKAAFIYNFAKFIVWPHHSDDRLRICVLADETFDGEFDKLSGKPVGTLRVQVEHPRWPHVPATCQILFISESESENLPRILRWSRDMGALTVSDAKGFLDRGVMIEMRMEDGHVTFEVNMAASREANLTISSKLLRLAKRVY